MKTFGRRDIARIALWIEAVILIVVGWIVTAVRTVTPWDEFVDESGTVTATSGQPFDIWPIGLALLCVGLAILAVALVVEAVRPSERAAEPVASGE